MRAIDIIASISVSFLEAKKLQSKRSLSVFYLPWGREGLEKNLEKKINFYVQHFCGGELKNREVIIFIGR